jgi:predicted DNA-binding protein (UPF0251 family)
MSHLNGRKMPRGLRNLKKCCQLERIEGQRLGRVPLNIDRNAFVRDRLAGMSLTEVAKKSGVSRASVVRFVKDARRQVVAA